MTGRATFGDFLQAAHRQLEGTATLYRDGARGNMDEVPRSLLREIVVMRHYLHDITATLHDLPARGAAWTCRPGPASPRRHPARPTVRAAHIDRAGERLIIDAAAEVKASRRRQGLELNSSTGATTLINHALMSGDPRAAALLRRPEPPAREPPEPEAEP